MEKTYEKTEIYTPMTELFDRPPVLEGGGITLRALTLADSAALGEMATDTEVYRYLPTFLFEQKYDDAAVVISRLYDECMEDALILGVYENREFCGLAEFYGYKENIHKVSLGYRLQRKCWGRGIATQALGLMVDHLYTATDVEIITASTMIDNKASARVLMKNGFELVVHAAGEDWGYDKPTPADKWIR